MGDDSYFDLGMHNALNEALTPLFRAAYVFELQEVEKRVIALQRGLAIADKDRRPDYERQLEALWARRNELLGLLWPALDVDPAEKPPSERAGG